jgi:hypothetical protein
VVEQINQKHSVRAAPKIAALGIVLVQAMLTPKAINNCFWPLVSVNDKPLRGRLAIIDPAQRPAH